MIFLYTSDLHFQGGTPRRRLDNYFETQLAKVREINQIAADYGATFKLIGGDMFDGHSPSYSVVNTFTKEWDKGGIKTLLIEGNHDLRNDSHSSLFGTALGVYVQNGNCHLLTKDNPFIFEDKEDGGRKIAFTGNEFHRHIDAKDSGKPDYIIKEKLGDIHVHMTHGMLTDKPLPQMAEFTLIDEIVDTKADITFCGHYHFGIGVIKRDGKYYANSGSPVRTKADKVEMKRKPYVLIVDTNGGKIKIRKVYLKSARPAEEVLDRNSLDEEKIQSEADAEYEESVRRASEGDSTINDIGDLISAVSTKEELPQEYRDKAIDIVQNTRDTLDHLSAEVSPILDDQGSIYIKTLVMEDFEAYAGEHIMQFSPQFNIIIGETGQGKSSIFRALATIYKNDANSTELKERINVNSDQCMIGIELSNGYIVRRIFNRGTINKYLLSRPDGTKDSFAKFGDRIVPPEIRAVLGMTYRYADASTMMQFNFFDQIESAFLLNDSAGEKARKIGMISGSHYVSGAIRTATNEGRAVDHENRKLLKQIEKEQEALEEYEWTAEALGKIQDFRKTLNLLVSSRKKLSKLTNSYFLLQSLEKRLSEQEEIIEACENLSLEKLPMNTISLTRLCDVHLGLTKDIERLSVGANALPVLEQEAILTQEIEGLQLESLRGLLQQQHAATEKIKTLNIVVSFPPMKPINESVLGLARLHSETARLKRSLSLKGKIDGEKFAENSNAASQIQDIFGFIQRIEDSANEYQKLMRGSNAIQRVVQAEELGLRKIDFDSSMIKLYGDHISSQAALTQAQKSYSESLQQLKQLEGEFFDALSEAGVCPTCGNTIDQETIAKMKEEQRYEC